MNEWTIRFEVIVTSYGPNKNLEDEMKNIGQVPKKFKQLSLTKQKSRRSMDDEWIGKATYKKIG